MRVAAEKLERSLDDDDDVTKDDDGENSDMCNGKGVTPPARE